MSKIPTIYTTYFSAIVNLPENVIPISICAKPPKWYHGREYKQLAPSYSILMNYKHNPNSGLYAKDYQIQVLNHLDPQKVMNDLFDGIPDGCTFALVCFEKPGEFCHRHLVADWLSQHGVKVREYL